MAGLLLFLAPTVFSGGNSETVSAEERVRQAAELIAQEQYNQAIEELTDIASSDANQLDPVEEQLSRIRSVNEQYVAKGEEVKAQLQTLLSADLAPDEVLPAAIQALELITQMEAILPNPNPRDQEIVEDLRYTVQLNIDRRRFQVMMDAAAEQLRQGDFSEAARIYVNGVSEAVELAGGGGTPDAGTGGGAPQSDTAITLENGIDIQRRFFEARDYGLLGEQVASTRETLRATAKEFVDVAPDALQRAADLAAAFAAGDFSDAQAKVVEYLNLLEFVTGYVRAADDAGAALSDAEAFISAQAADDPGVKYDWHVRFLRDIVLGREDAGDPEGLLYAFEQVRTTVETGPVQAARAYGDERYLEAIDLSDGVAWPTVATGFSGLDTAGAAVREIDGLLNRSAVSYRLYTEILAVSRSLDLRAPEPPSIVGEINDRETRNQWVAFSSQTVTFLSDLQSVKDDQLRVNIAGSSILAASASALRVVEQRALDGLQIALSRRTTIASLNSQRVALRDILGALDEPASGTLREIARRWIAFQDAASLHPDTDELAARALGYNASYLSARIGEQEHYERDIVTEIARLEYNGLNSRLSSLRSRADSAERQLTGVVEEVTSVDDNGVPIRQNGQIVTLRAVRKYPDRARDTLIPMVGTVSGGRIQGTGTGQLQVLLDDARDYVARYENEVPYVAGDPQIRADIGRGNEVAATVGEADGDGLFSRSRALLERALAGIATAEDLERQGDERVSVIRDLVNQALEASNAENLDTAGDRLAQAELLLKSDDARVTDASDLFADSLATWYRPDLESRWNAVQKELNDEIAKAQGDIVITRVQQAVRGAQPLVDEQKWADALAILVRADELWSSVFPQTVYPPLVRLLRYAETALAKQNERVLREDDPDYDKLAPLLSRATQAVSDGSYAEATQLVDQFLRAQPNNLEARLLEVDIALGSGEGDLTTKVDRLITNALPEGVSRDNLSGIDGADALELQSLLIAVQNRLSERPDVTESLLARLKSDIDTLEAILSPPPIRVATPDLRAESNALVDRALSNGVLETLSAADLAAALGLLEQALEVDPTNERAIDLMSFALRLPSAPRRTALDATEQQVFKQARDAFARGDGIGALSLIEQLWADPENRNDTELNSFREELLDALRRGA